MATERIIIEVQGRGFRRVQRSVSNLSREAKRSTSILQQLRNVLVVVAAARVVERFTDLADGFVNLRNRLQATLGSMAAARDAQAAIINIARETRTSVDATGDAFARLALGAKDLGIDTGTLLGVTKTLNQAIILSGATAQEARNAMIQLSQGIASGALRGDELRAVLEQLPKVSRLIATEFGVTIGELRKLGEAGALTTERIIAAFQRAAPQIEEEFRNTATTINQALTNVGTELRVLIDNVFNASGAANNLAEAIQGVANALRFLGENTGIVIGALTTIGFLIGGRLVQNAIKAIANLKSMRGAFRLAARSTGVFTKATILAGGAVRALNLAIRANPIGIAFTAFSLLAGVISGLAADTQTYTEVLETTNKVLDETAEKLEEGAYLTSKSATADLKATFAARELAKAKLEQAEAELIANDALGEFSGIGAENPAAAKVAELREEIRKLTLRQGDLRNVIQQLRDEEEKELAAKEKNSDANKKAENVIKKLQFQIAQLGRTEREAAIAQALFNAGLEFDAVGETADKIRDLAGRYYDMLEALKLVEEQQKLNEKTAERRIDLINRLGAELDGTTAAEIEGLEDLELARSALIKTGRDAALIDELLAEKKKELVEAQRKELFPELVSFLEENKSVREQLNDVEEEAAKIKRQALADGLGVAKATELETEAIKKNSKAILDNTEARKLQDKFFTARKSAEDFAEVEKSLKEVGEDLNLSQAEQNELLRLYLRDAAGASNAANDYAQAQEKLALAVRKGAVSQEEAIDIARKNRIELLESQRTAEAGAERAFLKFVDDATDAAAQTEALFTDVFTSLSDELYNFVREGEFNFNNLVQTIVDGLIKIAIQQAIGGAFGAGAGLFGAAGGGIGGSSGAPGGSAGGIGGFIASALIGGANGLSFTVGGSTAVQNLPGIDNRLIAFKARDGEEVTVSPRGEGAGGMGAPINIVQNIQTKDADSFKRSEGQQAVRASAVLQRARRRA